MAADLSERELGYYYFWRGVGQRMGINDIPSSYEAFEAWAREYERITFRFTETNQKVGAATRDLFASWYPKPVAPIVRGAIYALLDDTMIEAFGFPRPVSSVRALINNALKLRGRIVRWLPPRRRSNFFTSRPNRTHPKGYVIGALGPPRLIAADNKQQGRIRSDQGYR